MVEQGYAAGDCLIEITEGRYKIACQGTLKKEGKTWSRVITSAHLSRPEDYFSIYQSGCNHSCKKCHSWHFSQSFEGFWASADEIADMTRRYGLQVTVREPRERATMWHATDLCHHCGSCVTRGVRGPLCPRKLGPEHITLSPQGWGPVRNIIAFTGGDVVCQVGFYAQVVEKIKAECSGEMWVLLETNGYGLTPQNLDILASAGLDSFWLDIKAYDEGVYRDLCGATNRWILKTPEWIVDRGFVLEVLVLFIPNLVETDQIVKIAQLINEVDPSIPFTILAFFPAYKLKDSRPPTFIEMITSYYAVKEEGLENVKLGNCHVFTKSQEEWNLLISAVGRESIG
ncbi:MAG: radical SAM protein [Nitrososphaeria archaeon]|nr:radical SAM protein [Nitrososphaeria archaeon]NIQ32915.1 radical SAM protein [Nitrososphaeria archaeon]